MMAPHPRLPSHQFRGRSTELSLRALGKEDAPPTRGGESESLPSPQRGRGCASARERGTSGQALVEFALIAPLLVLMLGGIMYCGGLILAQENLTIAARAAARQMAVDAQERSLVSGRGGLGSGSTAQQALGAVTSGARGLSAAPPAWPSGVSKVNAYTAVYSRTMSKRIGKHSYQFGVGCLLYGMQVKKDLSHDLAPMARLANAMGGHLGGMAALGSNAVMPGDLPPNGGVGQVDASGGSASVLGLNTWITGIVNAKEP